MRGACCSVPGCKSKSKDKVSWHLFPSNHKIKQEWLRRIDRRTEDGYLWQPLHFHRICGKHFNESGKKETYNKYPIYFPNHTISGDTVRQVKNVNICEDLELGTNVEIGKQEVNIILQDCSITEFENTYLDHTYAKNINILEASKAVENDLKDKIEFLTNENKIKDDQLKKSASEINVLQSKCEHLDRKKTEIKTFVQRLQEDDKMLQFYTGFAEKTRFDIFADFIRPGYDLARKTTFKNADRYTSSNSILNYKQQLLLVLMRLKLGLLEQDIAYRFNLSVSTVSRIWSFWINLLHSKLSQVPNWPSRTLVNKHMPDTFKTLYPNTRVILHRMELQIEVSSQHKKHNTAKGIVGFAPNGLISFVSELFPGQTTDEEIFEECGILEKLEPDDEVMAERSFAIIDILETKNIAVNILPSLRVEEEVEKTRDVAKLRAQVDKSIRHLKTFKIIKHLFTLDKLNQIWRICCLLLNFINEPSIDIK